MYIPKSKWSKLSKVVRDKIRERERLYNFDYSKTGKDKILKKLYDKYVK